MLENARIEEAFMPITQQELAALAHVSTATVSRVLSGKDDRRVGADMNKRKLKYTEPANLAEVRAALCGMNVKPQTLTVKAILERDPASAYHSLLLDPITAAACSLDEACVIFAELWAAEGDLVS